MNLFKDKKITPERSADPMICSPEITLSQDELSFLRKGPRFMLRQEINDKDFKVELEKMTVKEKFNDCNKEAENDSITSDESLSELAEKEEAKTAMIYLKSDKTLDLGRIKATDYKFNKRVFLPEDESVDKEAIHEVRRATMMEIFKKTVGGD